MSHPSQAGTAAASAVERLPSATLTDVTGEAALLTRVERKYFVPADRFVALVAALPRGARALAIDGRRVFRYESVYFDSDDLLTYRQHLQGRRRRYKVRTRAYVDSGDVMFEVKLKGRRGQTVKERLPIAAHERARPTDAAWAFLAERLDMHYGIQPPLLRAVLASSYRRITLVDADGTSRLTADVDLCFDAATGSARGPADEVLVETKGVGLSAADRVLRDMGIRPVRVSKYAVGIAMLHPALPASPWHRLLRRHFGSPTTDGRRLP